MPRACSLCTHPDRLTIETAFRGGLPLRTIAAQWSVSKTALLRHRDAHLPIAPSLLPIPQEDPTGPSLSPEAARVLEQCRALAAEVERLRSQDWHRLPYSPSVVYDPLVRQLDALRRQCIALGVNPECDV